MKPAHAKFCAAYAVEPNGAAAYAKAYPKATGRACDTGASRLLKNADIRDEIQRIRNKAEEKVGGAVAKLATEFLSKAEKRAFLARLTRAQIAELPHDSDLYISIEQTEFGHRYKLPNKLDAIKLDNDLAGEGSEATANDALAGLLERCMK